MLAVGRQRRGDLSQYHEPGTHAAEGIQARSHLTEVPAAPSIARTAEDLGADLIVMGTHGHTGIKHILLGSVAERTLRLAPCSVLTVK